jgi:hypothetical protein
MKPIASPMSRQAFDLMNKAQFMIERIENLEKAKCDCPAGKCDCKDCPECGKKMTKMGSCKSGCNSMEKGLDMVEHDGKKVPKFAADGKGAKDMKTKANTFTIADAQKRNMGEAPEPRQPRSFPDEPDMSPMGEMPMREDTGESDFRMSEGPPRQQKRGERRGVAIKRPGFRGPPMPLTDKSATGDVERHEDARMPSLASRGLNTLYGKVRKAVAEGSQPGFATSYDSSPMGVMFMSETGGQTRNAYYTTNQYPYNAEDVANKGATSVQVSLDKLASMLNPHEGGGVSRLDNNGVLSNNPY